MTVTIYRRNGSVLFTSATATTTAEAVNEIVADARKHLSRKHLSRADLSGADLSRADLSWADLSRANLSWANLSGADLSRADLSWANLSRANLSRANLSRADLSRADLSGAINAPQLLQLGPVDNWLITLINTPSGWRIQAGCRDFTVAQARNHWMAESRPDWAYPPGHGARMVAAVEALVSLAATYGWTEKAPEPLEAEVAVPA